jgi:hypothetical protein
MTRFYGVLAPHATTRKNVVSKPDVQIPPQLQLFGQDVDEHNAEKKSSSRQTWSKLLARVFKIDVSVCPQCDGQMKIIDAVIKNETIRSVLSGISASRPRDGPPHATQLAIF